MKKFVLSTSIVIVFIVYIIYERMTMPSVQTSAPTQNNISTASGTSTNTATSSLYKDGTYVGNSFNNYYGNIQVQASISGGKLTEIQFLQYPKDQRQSQQINTQAMPQLISEAITVQSSKVDVISGATDSSESFMESLSSALSQAKI